MDQGTWINFILHHNTGKTKVYQVRAKQGNNLLGEIKWYATWRKYAFYPADNCVFEQLCLEEITNFIKQVQFAWAVEQKLKKQQQ